MLLICSYKEKLNELFFLNKVLVVLIKCLDSLLKIKTYKIFLTIELNNRQTKMTTDFIKLKSLF